MIDERPTDEHLDAVLEALPTAGPQPDTFEAIWARRDPAPEEAPPPSRPRWAQAWAAGCALCAAAVVFLVVDPALPASGRADGKGAWALPGGGAIVTDEGAALRFQTDWRGATEVEQQRGRAFYRAPPGRDFSVHTPAGDVHSTGTSFAVEVADMSSQGLLNKRDAVVGAVFAGLAAMAVVTVYEGGVRLVPEEGAALECSAGETATLAPTGARAGTPKDAGDEQTRALKKQVRTLEEQLKGFMLAEANGTSPLVEQNQRLQQQVAELSRQLEAESEMRAGQEGHAFAFPEGLPDAYRGDALRQLFTNKLQQSGLEGDIEAVDCSEFPCIVYGKAMMEGDDRSSLDKAFREMNNLIANEFDPERHHYNTSVWGGIDEGPQGKKQKNIFGFAIYPKDSVADGDMTAMKRRLRYRNTQYADQFLQE